MQNFDIARDALETSLNSSGSAMKEHEKWQQSLEAQINKLKASWQGLSQAFLKSDFLHGAIDAVIGLVDGLTKLIDTFGALPTILGTVAAGMSLFKNKGLFIFDKQAQSIQLFGTQLSGLGEKYASVQSKIARYNSLSAKSQATLRAQWANSNTSFAKYISGLNGAKASFGGYIKSLVGAKAATIGLQIATTAMNAAITMGISLLISWAIDGIMKLANAKKELAEKIEEVTSKFKEQHDELQKLKGDYNTSDEDSMISKYEKLSRGVDNLGRNVSLTADEYSEYQSIVNQIAEKIPSLVSGYDSQGNALLSCKGNVEELTKAYEDLIQAQNREVFNNIEDIGKDFKNAVDDFENTDFAKKQITSGTIKDLKNLIESGYTEEEEIKKFFDDKYGASNSPYYKEIKEALNKQGVELEGSWWTDTNSERIFKTLSKVMKTDTGIIENIIGDFESNLEEAIEGMQSIAQATLSDAFDISDSGYYDMSDTMKSVAKNVVDSFDFEFYKKYKDNPLGVKTYINDMLNELNSLSTKDGARIEAAFDLQTQFNGGKISYGEYVKGLEDTGKLIDGLDLKDELKSQLKLSMGLDEKGVVAEYKQLRNRLADSDLFNISEPQYESFLEGLSAEELSVLIDIIPELSETDYKETIADVKAALEKEMMLQGLTFDLNLEVEATGIEALNTALAESVTGSGLSSESITALKGRYADLEAQGYDLSVMFEETSHGIHLNRQEFNKLEKAYATEKLTKVDGELEKMKGAYDDLGEAIKNTDDPVKKAELYNDRQTLAKRISEAATLAAQYKGLTSAYNDWLAAEEAGQERDMYENIIEGFENIGDEISRGWYDDGTIEFLEMLTGKDLSTAGIDEVKKAYKGLDKEIKHTTYSVRDFFTVDDDGNATADGVYNFLDAIGQIEEEAFGGKDIVKRDKNGKPISFDFELAIKKDKDGNIVKNGDEAIAEALGISEELVQIMKRAADDAGFVVSMDGTYKQLADLQNEARAAADYLKSIGKTDFDFDFNTTSVADLKTQLAEAEKIWKNKDFWNKDGTFNFNAKGATEAMQVVSTLQAKIDNLTEKQYGIGLTVDDEEFKEPLENLQEYGRTVQTLNQLRLNPEVNAEKIESLEGDLKEISEYFAGLDGETKVELGFESDDNWEEVKKKIEDGEVTIPTVLDIQANMDKNLETLADLALLNSGLLSENEEETIKKKYNVEVEADEVDTSDVDEKVDNAINWNDGLNSLAISIIADVFGGDDVDSLRSKLEKLDDKTIRAIAEVLGQIDVDKLKNTIALLKPKTVEAIAKALGEGDVEGLKSTISQLEPRTVQAIAEAFGYSDVNALIGAIDNLDPKTVEAVANALGLSDVNGLQSAVDGMQGNTVDAKVNTDGQSTKIDTLQSKIDGMRGNTVTITTVMETVVKGAKKAVSNGASAGKKALKNRKLTFADGTANADGTTNRAFRQGSWGTQDSGTALVGELGTEVLVRNGRYYTIGDNGAEFIHYKKGDIIFNHIQSEELFKNGKVTSNGGRAKAFAQGTAFATGKGEYGGSAVGSDKEETFDWIETLISRVERAIDNLDKTAKNIYKSWDSRNSALIDEISKVRAEITYQKSAANTYMNEANAVDFSGIWNAESWKTRVRNGTLDISAITDENLKEKISEYQKWYEKALECNDAVEELKETESALLKQRFDNVSARYDGILQGFEHTENMLNEYIAQSEAKGHTISKNYYQALYNNEIDKISELEDEQAALIAERSKYLKDKIQFELLAKGMTHEEAIEEVKNSQAWIEMSAEIDSVTQAIEEGNTALIEYANSMRDIDWQVFDLIQERISNVAAEADFLIDLMSYEKLFDDNGKLTDKGMATMGLHGQNINTYMYQADDYGAKVKEIDSKIASGEYDAYDRNVLEKRQEYVELQREAILNAEDEKQAIKDLVEEGINLELDALQERIDLHNEELDSMKDLYDYEKQVRKQSEEIASLEKRRAAYLNDDSEESKAKIQEITVSLKEAKESLEETEFERYIGQQEQLLDELFLEYENILNTRLGDTNALITQVIDAVNIAAGAEGTIATALGAEGIIAKELVANGITIKSTLENEAKNVGATPSAAMNGIWSVNEGNAKSVLETYGKGFQDKQTSTNAVLSDIKTYIGRMVDDIDKDAQTKVTANKTTTSAKKDPTKTTATTAKPNNASNSSTGDGNPKVGDKVKFLSGQYYYDSQGKKPLGSHKQGQYVYITRINKESWATHPYHISTGKKLGSGDLGWLKLNQLSGYATGKKNFSNNEIAWTQENGQEFIIRPSDGAVLTPIAKGDSVLTSAASSNIWDMANSPAEFIKNNLNLSAASVPNNSNVNNSYSQHIDNVVFRMDNVKNYEEMLSAMKADKNFDRLIKAMTIDQIAGKSSLAKNKSIR